MKSSMQYDEKLEVVLESTDNSLCEDVPDREAISLLMYAMVGTRSDLALSVAKLFQFCEDPREKYWVGMKRILRYRQGTRSFSICFDRSFPLIEVGYCSADWAGDVMDRISVAGYIIIIEEGTVSW